MLTAVVFAPLAVLLGQVLARDGLELVPVDDHDRRTRGGRAVPRPRPLAVPRAGARASLRAPRLEPGDTRGDGGRVRRVQPLPRRRRRRVPRLPLHRSVDGARRHRDAAVVHVRRVARLAGHRRRRAPRRSARSSSSAATRRTAGSRPARSCRSPTPSGRSGSSPPGSCSSRSADRSPYTPKEAPWSPSRSLRSTPSGSRS